MSNVFELPEIPQWAEPFSELPADEEEIAVNTYENFAEIYDGFGSEKFCQALCAQLKQLLPRYGISPGATIADLACGTGVITTELARSGYRMLGMDLSEDMLRYARDRARKAGVEVPFQRADLRSFQLPHPVECAISTHDVLDHLFMDDELDQAFEQVALNLLPRGLFIFDMNCWEGIRHLDGRTTFVETESRSAVYQMIAVERSLETNITGFLKNESGSYDRFNEVLYQRCYSDEEIMERLEDFEFQLLDKIVLQNLEEDRFKQMWIVRRLH